MVEGNRDTVTRDLIDCLRDQCWQVRAAASNVIASFGPAIITEVCPLLQDSDENVRIALASILVGLGEAELLQRVLAGDSHKSRTR